MNAFLKFGSAALAALCLTPSSHAADTTTASPDSTSVAMATIVAQFVKPAIAQQYQADSLAQIACIDGITAAFNLSPSEKAFHNGISQGSEILSNLNKMRADGYDIDFDAFIAAFRNILIGNQPAIGIDDAKKYMDAISQRLTQSKRDSQQAFIDAQAARQGVRRLPSGLLFEVISEGSGDCPNIDDTVEVKYSGRLADGSVFDASPDDSTVKFPIKGLIKGFSEGLLLMRPGGSYRLIIPAEIGYGDRGAGDIIPPGAALDFSVTLVSIVKK